MEQKQYTESKYIIESIKNKYSIVEYLSSIGIHFQREYDEKYIYLCPFKNHVETKPSFTVYRKPDGQEDFFCFGCLEENEKIWSNKGLVNIGDVKKGDKVINIYGNIDNVINVEKKVSYDCMSFMTGAFNYPIILTKDHICIAIKKEDAIKNLPYINERKDNQNEIRFNKKNKGRKRRKNYKELTICQMEAKDLKNNDFIMFPVIPDNCRNNSFSFSDLYINEHIYKYENKNIKGPKRKCVDLIVNKKTAKFYGLYLSEGSYSGRNIKISMHLKEKKYLEELKEILLLEFGLYSKIYDREEKNICELNCSSVLLGEKLSYCFGKGAKNKKVPVDCLYWDEEIQKEFVRSYFIGDGSENGKLAISISSDLLQGIFAVSIQCGLLPSFGVANKEHTDKNNVFHNKSYSLYLKDREGISGFYENIGNTKYYFSIIKEIKNIDSEEGIRVVDISVDKTETFLTKLGIIHNCKSSGNFIVLYAKIHEISWADAVKELSKDFDFKINDHIDFVIKQLKESLEADNIEENARDIFGFVSLNLSTIGYNYLVKTGFDSDEYIFLESLYKKLDQYIEQEDIHGLIRVNEFVNGKNKIKKNLFNLRLEKWVKNQREKMKEKIVGERING